MTELIDAARLDLPALLRPGDRLVCGQGTAEPLTLTRRLVEAAATVGPLELFVGPLFSNTFTPQTLHGAALRLKGYGAMGAGSRLWAAGLLDVVPEHYSALNAAFASGARGADVVLLQAAPPQAGGGYSLGLVNDYAAQAARHARLVIVEVNSDVPWTHDAPLPEGLANVLFVAAETHAPLDVPPTAMGATEAAIAAHVAELVPERATLQIGIGAVPDTVLAALGQHRDLGLHSGVIGDRAVELIEAGIVTNAHKSIDAGLTVTNAVFGTQLARRHVHANPGIRVRPARYTHGREVLASIDRLVTVNSALEVDLSGQANTEMAGGAYVGGTGGLMDFARAARLSRGGRSIIALPATARKGTVSRIVPRLANVTLPKSDADVVVTEHGVADLRGLSLAERAGRMIAIADPAFREELERAYREAQPHA
ncbi:4-hydroxybutyrate CoA-transferase [Azorhizobium oxalatiphilum]|uniref:4-hydroxybutyrate CoA-transferase n=1 Tax=Azorhizobium oxalatiphilum TaxID=980631 RepID=A0A917C5L3_9HYPH|nr:acetyl-CoA hydrolase/transferase family protein [Azorhizobium oxalatiphilum]GGF69010.1 4-hydroxybutyrate CoA-transferase [Azorhizobium oxalatiphilum]